MIAGQRNVHDQVACARLLFLLIPARPLQATTIALEAGVRLDRMVSGHSPLTARRLARRAMIRTAALLAVMIAVSGDRSGRSAQPALSRDEPYVRALFALDNLSGCLFQPHKARKIPSQSKSRAQSVKAIREDFFRVEKFARSNGLGDYLARGRKYFTGETMSELRVGCRPSEASALRNARVAIRQFRAHVANMAHRDS